MRSVRLLGVRPAMEHDAHGQARARRQGAAAWVSWTGWYRPPSSKPPRASCSLKQPAAAPAAVRRAAAELAARALVREAGAAARRSRARRSASTTRRPTPSSICGRSHGARGARAYEAEARSIAHLFTTRDRAQPGARVPAAGSAEGAGRQGGRAPVKHVHVVGAGVMGGDIAAWCALRGFTVTLQDRALEYVEPALKRARELFDKRIRDRPERADARDAPARGCRRRGRAGGRRRHRGDLREPRGQARAVRAARAAHEARRRCSPPTPRASCSSRWPRSWRDPGVSSACTSSIPWRRCRWSKIVHAPRRPTPALAQAAHRLRAPARQAAAALPQRAGLPRQPRAHALPARGDVRRAGRRAAGADRSRPPSTSACRWVPSSSPMWWASMCASTWARSSRASSARTRADLRAAATQLVAAKKLGRKSGAGFLRLGGRQGRQAAGAGAPRRADLIDRLILVLVNECVACLREGVVERCGPGRCRRDLRRRLRAVSRRPARLRAQPRASAKCVARLEELAARYGSRFRAGRGLADCCHGA